MIKFIWHLISENQSAAIIIYFLSSLIDYHFMEYANRKKSHADVPIGVKVFFIFFSLIPFLNTIYALLCLMLFIKGWFYYKPGKKDFDKRSGKHRH